MSEKAILSFVQPADEPDFVIIHQDRHCSPAASTVLRLGFAHERFEVAFAGDLEATNLTLTREWVDGFLAALSAKRVNHPGAELGPDNPIGAIRRQAQAARAASQELPLPPSEPPVGCVATPTVAEGCESDTDSRFQGDLCTCGRVTRRPVCSGCLDRLHIQQSLRAVSAWAARGVGVEGGPTPPSTPPSQLCRGIGQPRLVALPRAAWALLGRFLHLAGGASRSAGLFGGPVGSFIRVFLSPFVAERKGAWNCLTKVALKLVNSCALEPACPRL